MVAAIKKKLSESAGARWTVLGLVSFTMLTGYVLSDIMSPLKPMLEQQLGWGSTDYGIFTSGYGWFNIFLLMLIFGGMILDRLGARVTGIAAVILMIIGAGIKYWAISTDFHGAITTLNIFRWHIFSINSQVLYAALGFGVCGVGIEVIGITANKIVVKWFRGRSLATALGLNVAAGRIGTFIAMSGSIPVAKAFGTVAAPVAMCLMILCIGLLAFLVFIMIDKKAETQDKVTVQESSKEDDFKLSDIVHIASIRGFWYITILCLLFYSAVFPFLKYATDLMIQKFHMSENFAGTIPGLLPFGNILLTPLFGMIYDHKGRGATIMLIGSIMLVAVHLLFAVPALASTWIAVVLILLLGAAFSLVPSAMWPSVPKIVPYRMLGTAYAMIFWIQNWGLAGVPLLIGWALDKYCVQPDKIMINGKLSTAYDYTIPMLLFMAFGVLSVVFALLLKHEDKRKGYGLELPNIKK